MDKLFLKTNSFAVEHFKVSAKEFIEKGIEKGRHYYYLRDALQINDTEFSKLMQMLEIDIGKVEATKADYEKIFEEPKYIEDELEDEEEFKQYA